jgi:hypothetical protein
LHGNSSTIGGGLGQHALQGSDSVDDDASSGDRFGTSLPTLTTTATPTAGRHTA